MEWYLWLLFGLAILVTVVVIAFAVRWYVRKTRNDEIAMTRTNEIVERNKVLRREERAEENAIKFKPKYAKLRTHRKDGGCIGVYRAYYDGQNTPTGSMGHVAQQGSDYENDECEKLSSELNAELGELKRTRYSKAIPI